MVKITEQIRTAMTLTYDHNTVTTNLIFCEPIIKKQKNTTQINYMTERTYVY